MKKTFIEPELLRIELSMTENIAVSGDNYYDIPITYGLYHATFDSTACVIIDTYLPYNVDTVSRDIHTYYGMVQNCFWFGE